MNEWSKATIYVAQFSIFQFVDLAQYKPTFSTEACLQFYTYSVATVYQAL